MISSQRKVPSAYGYRYFSGVANQRVRGGRVVQRHVTHPEPQPKLLLERLKIAPAAAIAAQNHRRPGRSRHARVVQTSGGPLYISQALTLAPPLESAKSG